MFVKIIIYADENKYSAVLISGENKKRVRKRTNLNSKIKTLLTGIIDCLEKLKYPVEIEIISDSRKLGNVLNEDIEVYKNKKYVTENIKLWKKLNNLLNEQIYYTFTYNDSKEKDDRIFRELYRDCLYKRF